MTRIRVGVSRCLLGDAVRYDGGHKRAEIVCEVLGRLFDLVPVCPEVAAGLGVPRTPVRLEEGEDRVRVVGVGGGPDVTGLLYGRSRELAAGLADLGGFVLKSRSPSCGVKGIPVFRPGGGEVAAFAAGMFAGILGRMYSEMPVVEESDLAEPRVLEDFVRRVRHYDRRRREG